MNVKLQLPGRSALSAQWYGYNNPWQLDLFPERIPRQVITHRVHVRDGRPKRLGMPHFGDAVDVRRRDEDGAVIEGGCVGAFVAR